MPNIISSAIVNSPPPDMVADVLNKRNKVHHFDKQTDEKMIPLFPHGVDGKSRNNKHLLPHRNWCSIRQWVPGDTPPPTPPESRTPSPPPAQGQGGAGGLLRRFSLSRKGSTTKQPELSRDSVRGPKPPISRAGGLLRSFSRRKSTSEPSKAGPPLARTMSLDSGKPAKRGFFNFGRRPSQSRPNDGGINGQWGAEDEDDDEDDEDEDDYYYQDPQTFGRPLPSGLRGGAASYDEYSEGDEEFFSTEAPRRAQTMGVLPSAPMRQDPGEPPRRPFHRTPTGLSTKQMRTVNKFEVDLEGGLDICLNVEVNPKDPTGITVPYRLLVPKLFYEYSPEDDQLPVEEPTGIKKFLSLRKKQPSGPGAPGKQMQ